MEHNMYANASYSDIKVTTTMNFDGFRVKEYKGIVRGLIVRSPTIAQGILGGLKSIIGGQIGSYRDMCDQGRQQAFDLLVEHARSMGANAVIGLRYDTSDVGVQIGATEILCYGTAVIIVADSRG